MTNLKVFRESYGFTIQELAEETGINRVTLSQYENGQKDIRYCRAETLIKIADALQIENVRYLFGSIPAEFYEDEWPF